MDTKAINQGLIKTVLYLAKKSPYYKRLFSDTGIDPYTIQSIDDLKNIPTTSKTELQNNNSDFFCIEPSDYADIVSTSGTLGEPVVVPLTKNDIRRLAVNEAGSFTTAGVNNNDLVQLMVTLDMRFMAGLAYFEGIQKIGAATLRIGPGSPAVQLENIRKFSPTVLVGVPGFISKIIDYTEKNNININHTSVKKIICIGDAIRDEKFELNSIGKRIKERWHIDLYSTYASTEMATSFTECNAGKGGHLQEDLLVVEILDDEGNVLPYGELGEVTITTLGIEGMPLLRFRTGDMAFLVDRVCECGRNAVRISPIIGRKEQMIKYKGTTLYPAAIIDVLNKYTSVVNYYIEVNTDDNGIDQIQIAIAIENETEADECLSNLKDSFKVSLRVVPNIFIKSSKEIMEQISKNQGRKPKLFFDYRQNI
ncbi:phenylacetate--CoA ligase family protein [Maribellus mangrovi]|uniref:phenylacetate--CoA ligase family protein n=1 Tax=Maribellus mangrovi TaxID=3133146 RepID=UPI0030ED17CE